MNYTSDFIYSSTTSGAALRDEHVSHSATGQPSEYNIGDRELLVESSPNGGAKEGESEFREFGELFSDAQPHRDIELTVLTNNQGYAAKVFTWTKAENSRSGHR